MAICANACRMAVALAANHQAPSVEDADLITDGDHMPGVAVDKFALYWEERKKEYSVRRASVLHIDWASHLEPEFMRCARNAHLCTTKLTLQQRVVDLVRVYRFPCWSNAKHSQFFKELTDTIAVPAKALIVRVSAYRNSAWNLESAYQNLGRNLKLL